MPAKPVLSSQSSGRSQNEVGRYQFIAKEAPNPDRSNAILRVNR